MLLINSTEKQERKLMSTDNSTSSIWIVLELWEWNLPSFSSKYTNHVVGIYPTKDLAHDLASLKARTNAVNKEDRQPKYFIQELQLDKWDYK